MNALPAADAAALPAEEVVRALGTSAESGLGSAEAERRHDEIGPNALGEHVDASVVLAVVVLNTIIGFVQEYLAGKEIEALLDLVP